MKLWTFITQKFNLRRNSRLSAAQATNFFHLYGDIGWFGLAFGSTLSFLPIFATRLSATGWQIGLLNAIPALVGVLLTMWASRWIEARPLGRAVRQGLVIQRLGFLAIIPLPLFFSPQGQIWTVILLTLLMAIPGSVVMVAFNAMLATIVEPEFRGQVVGRRNALFAATIMLSFLVSGAILDRLPFEWGYVVVFSLGAIGAALSTYHVVCIQMPNTPPKFKGRLLHDQAQSGQLVASGGGVPQRRAVGVRMLLQWRPNVTTLQRLSGRYWWAMLAFFLFHFSQMLPVSVIPLFWVRELNLTDGEIGWVNATFFFTMLLASLALDPLSKRLGNYFLTAWGAILLSLGPFITALSKGMPLLLVANIAGGSVWAILSGAMFNRLLDIIPEDDRPVHLAVYNMALNVAVLTGTMSGSFLADRVGLRETLIAIAVLRVLSGLALARWG